MSQHLPGIHPDMGLRRTGIAASLKQLSAGDPFEYQKLKAIRDLRLAENCLIKVESFKGLSWHQRIN